MDQNRLGAACHHSRLIWLPKMAQLPPLHQCVVAPARSRAVQDVELAVEPGEQQQRVDLAQRPAQPSQIRAG